ncbi:Lipid-binding SYLF domain-containing protein [Colwellia chukchiensis]|uniref:Lipid-binding SYLF domain-containing protein n=1 Tax=Colwellia chukchiensis TaxID=641665 RepID=A0A1H7IWI5_9GAMM|nr:YSC84-related protein [Colwellia chukchiensis]SEK66738.1 Lipid-binding SYLF domain-containing protein [Colwellia chukchiensis]
MKSRSLKSIKTLFFVVVALVLTACANTGSGTKVEQQQKILQMKETVLTQLFASKPDTRQQLAAAPGYAVFSNANINLLFIAAGAGYGVVKDQATHRYTYMNMAEGGVGLGLGVKDYRIVMVFHTQAAMTHFIENGWTFGGNADASLKAGNKGAAVAGEAYFGDVTVYTFTESGLALQATIKGTKFWPEASLN